jgi:signal transduction histidine kinase/DNA-binding response OmpR family regulator
MAYLLDPDLRSQANLHQPELSMTDSSLHFDQSSGIFLNTLLSEAETILVAAAGETSRLLQILLENDGLPVITAANLEQIHTMLGSNHVALLLIEQELLGDIDEKTLQLLSGRYPELGIIIITPWAEHVDMLEWLDRGCDDWLIKPLNEEQVRFALARVLKKRSQLNDYRVRRRDQQLTNLRTQFLHHLIVQLNRSHLSEFELGILLQTILIGITSEEGLAFNRAFLALFNDDRTLLKGTLAIGPDSRADALTIWEEIKSEKLDLQCLFERGIQDPAEINGVVNAIVQSLAIPAGQTEHPLIRACLDRRSVLVKDGRADIDIPDELIKTLNQNSFVITPLYSPDRSLGVIIADNFITNKPIEQSDVEALEIFAGQASLAIEHSHLHRDMQKKIKELELITEELEKSRDMLVESDRFIALGHMSAQLVHALRNPITSIGGTARLLEKRVSEPKDRKFLKVLVKESAKVESTLHDLYNFVSESKLEKSEQSVFSLVKRAAMAFYGVMKKQSVSCDIELPGDDPLLFIDPDKIYQAFLHLVRNSLDSMTSGGRLTIRADISNDRLKILISDTGSGMINGDLTRATDPFYTTKTYGTGMGLTLVEQILGQHGAHFALAANDEQGMTATVTFPLS